MEPQNTNEHRMERREGPKSSWIPLLLGSILLVAYLFLPGCAEMTFKDCSDSDEIKALKMMKPSLSALIDIASVEGLNQEAVVLSSQSEGASLPDTVTYIWIPPQGATGFTFVSVYPIEPGGPPFLWKNVPVNEYGVTTPITACYTPPPIPEGQNEIKTVNTFQAIAGDQVSTSTYEATFSRGEQSDLFVDDTPVEGPRPVSPSEPAAELDEKLANEDYYVWQAETWHHSDGTTVTTNSCQDVIDFLMSGNAFFAVRAPALPLGQSGDGSYTLPVVTRGEQFPTAYLLDSSEFPATTIITIPLEYKPQYFTFLANELPAVPGEQWMALGVSASAAITCPEGMDISSDNWEIYTQVWFDFGGEEGACAGHTLPVYFCYEGDSVPPILRGLGMVLGSKTSGGGYPDQQITYIGPQLLTLPPSGGRIEVAGITFTQIVPPERVSFHHDLQNRTIDAVTVDVTYTSTLGIEWQLYGGSNEEPDLSDPIEGLITLEKGPWFDLWLIADVPEDAPEGGGNLYVTMTSVDTPTLTSTATDLFWVGELVYAVYLPLALK